MITLETIMDLMPYTTLDFSFDSFIQIMDYSTNAHYRWNELENCLTLGGHPVLCSMADFMKLPIRYIEYIDDQCVISVGGSGIWA